MLEVNIATLLWPAGFLHIRKCYSSLEIALQIIAEHICESNSDHPEMKLNR